jgi:hypothetical protein
MIFRAEVPKLPVRGREGRFGTGAPSRLPRTGAFCKRFSAKLYTTLTCLPLSHESMTSFSRDDSDKNVQRLVRRSTKLHVRSRHTVEYCRELNPTPLYFTVRLYSTVLYPLYNGNYE